MVQKTEQLSRTNPHVYVYIFPLIISVEKRQCLRQKRETEAQGFTFHLYYPLVFCA